MDLTGINPLKVLYSFDEETGQATITFKDSAETTELGSIIIETTRHRGLIDALQVMAKSYQPDDDVTIVKHRVVFDKNADKADVAIP